MVMEVLKTAKRLPKSIDGVRQHVATTDINSIDAAIRHGSQQFLFVA